MDIQIPTKLRRNSPCTCGSGRKFKKCCGKIEGEKTMTEGQMLKDSKKILKNEFRKEVRDPYAGIPEDELLTRGQAVLLRELSFRKAAIEADHAHFEAAIERGKAVRREILAMPKSPYREAVLQDLDAQIKGQTEKAETMRFPGAMKLTLLALEELFAEKTGGEPMISPPVMEEVEELEDETPELSDDDNPKEFI